MILLTDYVHQIKRKRGKKQEYVEEQISCIQ